MLSKNALDRGEHHACYLHFLTATTLVFGAGGAWAQSNAAALAGKVTSAEEGAMEGVVVSAKQGIVMISVVSNARGEFSFPARKLGAGDYALTIRAAGYVLDGPK